MSTINANKTVLQRSIPNGMKWAKPVKVYPNFLLIGNFGDAALDPVIDNIGLPRQVQGIFIISGKDVTISEQVAEKVATVELQDV